MLKNKIYLDCAATTPVDARVLKAMSPYFSRDFGNASSLHYAGLDGRVAVDRAQAKIAKFLGCQKGEVYFTSGATESDNMAIFGVSGAIQRQQKGLKIHIITSQIEHDAILEPCRQLAKNGSPVTFLPVNKQGLVELNRLKKAIRPNTVLVSVMYVNNEIGAIQPVKEIGALIKKLNQKRKNKIYFHIDATQALSYCDCDVRKLNADLMSISAHKIYGPKGVGAIYIKAGTPFEPIMFGGHQQAGVRSGTYNVPGIVGLGVAVEILLDQKARKQESKKARILRDYLIKEIKKRIQGVLVNGDLIKRTPNNANFIFKGVEGESAVLMLSEKGVAVSTGSACSSGSLEPSHVLTALGLRPELSHGSLRITLGRFTTKKEIDYLLEILPPIIGKLRKMSPLKFRNA